MFKNPAVMAGTQDMQSAVFLLKGCPPLSRATNPDIQKVIDVNKFVCLVLVALFVDLDWDHITLGLYDVERHLYVCGLNLSSHVPCSY